MRPVRTLPAIGALVLGLVVLVGGCTTASTAPKSAGPEPDRASTQCRHEWELLGQRIHGRGDQSDPSDLAERWNSVVATVHYYTRNATASDCRDALPGQRAAISRIKAFSEQLRRFDIAHRMAPVVPAAVDYLAEDRTGRPNSRKGHRPPSRASIKHALRTLQQSVPASVADMRDGWDEGNSVDLDDARARRRVINDLKFLAGDSAPFQHCLRALRTLERLDRSVHPGRVSPR